VIIRSSSSLTNSPSFHPNTFESGTDVCRFRFYSSIDAASLKAAWPQADIRFRLPSSFLPVTSSRAQRGTTTHQRLSPFTHLPGSVIPPNMFPARERHESRAMLGLRTRTRTGRLPTSPVWPERFPMCSFVGVDPVSFSGIHKVCLFVGVPPRCEPRVCSAADPPPQSGGSAIRADIGEALLLTAALAVP